MEIKIKYHNSEMKRIEAAHDGEWYDLRVAEDVFIKKGEYALVNLGVSIELPKGYEAHVIPRSSTFKNTGIIMTNSMGLIDNKYCGDNDVWRFPAYCLVGKTIKNGVLGTQLCVNDRICQFRIVKEQERATFVEVENLENDNRGGIGSTGTK